MNSEDRPPSNLSFLWCVGFILAALGCVALAALLFVVRGDNTRLRRGIEEAANTETQLMKDHADALESRAQSKRDLEASRVREANAQRAIASNEKAIASLRTELNRAAAAAIAPKAPAVQPDAAPTAPAARPDLAARESEREFRDNLLRENTQLLALAKLQQKRIVELHNKAVALEARSGRAELIAAAAVEAAAAAPAAGPGAITLENLIGCAIAGGDGTFLGIVSADKWDEKSISNTFGDYGGKFSASSIFNSFSEYGDQFSDTSAFNRLASKPPKVIDKAGKVLVYLTQNKTITPAMDPGVLLALLKAKER